jgi:hypothetical protein
MDRPKGRSRTALYKNLMTLSFAELLKGFSICAYISEPADFF